MGYGGQVGGVWGSGRWGIGDFFWQKIGCMGVGEVGYGDQVGAVWRSGIWGMGIFLAKNGVYGERGGGGSPRETANMATVRNAQQQTIVMVSHCFSSV